MLKESKKKDTIIVEGEIMDILPGLEYNVRINHQGLEHDLVCYVSGKMRTNYIQLDKGDKVQVEISLYDIDKGRIVYRVSKKVPNNFTDLKN